MSSTAEGAPHVALFVTCLVDLFRPSVGFASVKLLEEAGCRVSVPVGQTCCGQPAYNSGDRDAAAAIARQAVETFEGYDYVVVPSGSCGATIKKDYPALLQDDPAYAARAAALSEKTFEIVSFLADVLQATPAARFPARVCYHDSCSGLRALGVQAQPRRLLAGVEGLELEEMAEAEVCCGFGGTFCVKFPEISNAMVEAKTANAAETGASLVLAGDLGCLMNIAGKLAREGRPMAARHVVEVLAGDDQTPPIGAPRAREGAPPARARRLGESAGETSGEAE